MTEWTYAGQTFQVAELPDGMVTVSGLGGTEMIAPREDGCYEWRGRPTDTSTKAIAWACAYLLQHRGPDEEVLEPVSAIR